MKHILITGSTRGIGLGLAKRFIEKGLKVTINGTTETGVQECLKNLRLNYPDASVQGFKADVSDFDQMKNLWENAIEKFGKIDIWINNAGIDQPRNYAWEIEPDAYQNIIKTNITGLIHGSRIAFLNMQQQGGGQIFNMEGFGSDGMMLEKMAYYGMSKRAVRYFTRSLAKEAKKSNVKVGTISPGMVLTDFLLHSLKSNPTDAENDKKIFNILADKVETVTPFLCKKILENKKNNAHIAWLTNFKIIWRFSISLFYKRNIF